MPTPVKCSPTSTSTTNPPTRYPLDWQAARKPPSYRVEKMLPKGKVDSAEGAYKVYHTLKYNDTLTLHGIPERPLPIASATAAPSIGSSTNTASKPTNAAASRTTPTEYCDDPQYILKLIERVITVSLRTVDIVEGLARLPFRPESVD